MSFLYRRILQHPIITFYTVAVTVFFYFNPGPIQASWFYLKLILFVACFRIFTKLFFKLFLDEFFHHSSWDEKLSLPYQQARKQITRIFLVNSSLFIILPGLSLIISSFHSYTLQFIAFGLLLILYFSLTLKKINKTFGLKPNWMGLLTLKIIVLLHVVSITLWIGFLLMI